MASTRSGRFQPVPARRVGSQVAPPPWGPARAPPPPWARPGLWPPFAALPLMSSARPVRLLLLFQGEWEDHAVTEWLRTGELALEREGFDVMRFPACLR